VLLLALLVLGAGAVAAVTVVPSADITLTPRIEAIGPISFTVVADPAATAVDPAAAVIPATTLQVPVSASGEFPATGRKVVKERATGTVRFTNCDPSSAYTLPSATVVRTRGGIGFTLDESVFLPVASISGTPPNIRVKCTTNDVAVRAADAGVGGNVDAGEIRVVPARYNRNLVRVTNPAATAGGSRQEFPRVKQEDVDAAIATLKADTHAELDAALQDPATVPAGRTAFPDTATLGALATDVDPATLVNQEVATFPLTMTGTGSVQAVDATPIQAIAQQRLEASLGEGDELVPGSVDVRVGEGSVVNGMVSFTVDGSAKQVRPLDAATIERQVLGLSRPEAERVLATYGDAIVALWPDYVTTVPTMESRVRFTLHDPVDRSPSEPTPSPRATTAPTRTTEPATDPGRSASPGAFPLPESPSDGAPSEPVPSG